MSERAVFISETTAHYNGIRYLEAINSNGVIKVEPHIRRGEMKGYQVRINAPMENIKGYLSEAMLEGMQNAA